MAKDTFTSKQREIVARKMGYDGPMQMFDEYLASSPVDAQRFSGIATKYMAKGGLVRKYAAGGMVTSISDQQIKQFYEQNKANPAMLKQTAAKYGVSAEDVKRATGASI